MAKRKEYNCSSVNLDRFIRPSLRWAGLYLRLEEFSGVTSRRHLKCQHVAITLRCLQISGFSDDVVVD